MLGAIVMVTLTVPPWPFAFVPEMETGNVPEAVGVPVISPVTPARAKPGGNPAAR